MICYHSASLYYTLHNQLIIVCELIGKDDRQAQKKVGHARWTLGQPDLKYMLNHRQYAAVRTIASSVRLTNNKTTISDKTLTHSCDQNRRVSYELGKVLPGNQNMFFFFSYSFT